MTTLLMGFASGGTAWTICIFEKPSANEVTLKEVRSVMRGGATHVDALDGVADSVITSVTVIVGAGSVTVEGTSVTVAVNISVTTSSELEGDLEASRTLKGAVGVGDRNVVALKGSKNGWWEEKVELEPDEVDGNSELALSEIGTETTHCVVRRERSSNDAI